MTKISKILVRKLKSDRIEYGAGGWGCFRTKKIDLSETPPPLQGEGEEWFSNEQMRYLSTSKLLNVSS